MRWNWTENNHFKLKTRQIFALSLHPDRPNCLGKPRRNKMMTTESGSHTVSVHSGAARRLPAVLHAANKPHREAQPITAHQNATPFRHRQTRGSAPSTPHWDQTNLDSSYGQSTPTSSYDAKMPLLPHTRQSSSESLHPPSLTPSRRPDAPVFLPLRPTSHGDRRTSDFDASFLYQHSGRSSSASKDVFSRPQSPYKPQRTRRHPFAQWFEPPDWRWILLHVLLCLVAYPSLWLFVFLAKNKSLFWTRAFVGVGCGIVGFWLGWSLINLGRAFVEAAAWATLIHQSRMNEAEGLKLKDFAATSSDAGSTWTALMLLWNRSKYNGTLRAKRKQYDSRFWSFYILFFLALVGCAATLPFILGRIVNINTNVTNEQFGYTELLVKGALADADVANAVALQPALNDFTLTWTLSPFSTNGGLPPTVNFFWQDDPVYFAETARSQLQPDGRGFGTFEVNTTIPDVEKPKGTQNGARPDAMVVGSLIRYPRWGIRIHCRKIPDPTKNIIPRSANNKAYLLMPQDTMRDLFTSFSIDLPRDLQKPLNTTQYLDANDTLPGNPDFSKISLAAPFFDNGVAHSLRSFPMSMGEDGRGFVTVEAVLVRLNTSYTPSGKFPVFSDQVMRDASGKESRIGFDGAVCLEVYEPWVVETYNTTFGAPTSMRIVSKDNEVRDNVPREFRIGKGIDGARRQLNSTGMLAVYDVAHGNSVNQIIKDNGRDADYVPSPTIISFTNGLGPQGYTELSETIFARARALADATNVLPYFAGTGDILARSYADRVIADASFSHIWLATFTASVLVLGIIAGLCVPRLPLGARRRGFELYSWVAAFQGSEMVSEMSRAGVERNMDLKDIEEKYGDMKFRYVF
ncbi:hypothetical protein HGRIS_006415 [Hohenbuehelia grisea]|uniref:Uncharacterized protein n=1 Tax=Hohenbuehelia grisea TaxID=104357 RepID=A0ABR3K090_9AGAR